MLIFKVYCILILLNTCCMCKMLPPPVYPLVAAGAETQIGHQVAPPRLSAPGTFSDSKVGGAEAA